MGIKKNEIIYIDINDLASYDGPSVLLPVSMPLIKYCEHGLAGMFSDKITPIFIGLTMAKDILLLEEVQYLKNYEPIGCRDERTYNTMQKYGIKAYLNGCPTIAFPKRRLNTNENGKIFVIDAPKEILSYMPDEFRKRSVIGTHLYYECIENPIDKTKKRFLKYCEDASLIVTSLLHCSVPCTALGIPVILVKSQVSYRFSWVEAFLPIYTPDEYVSINWNPAVVDVENIKEIVEKIFVKRMTGQTITKEMNEIHSYYMNRRRKKYIIDAFDKIKRFIDEKWQDHNETHSYAVWGLTQMAEMTVSYIQNNYHNAVLTHVYDISREKKLSNIQAIHPDEIVKYPEETIFVTALGASKAAEELFKKTKKENSKYCILEAII